MAVKFFTASIQLHTGMSRCVVDLPKDCGEVFNRGQKSSGLYAIKPHESKTFLVNCEFTEGKNKAFLSHISEFLQHPETFPFNNNNNNNKILIKL